MKKTIYIILWALLGLIISFIFHAIIELIYLKLVDPASVDWVSVVDGACALPIWLIYLLPIIFIALGIYAGFYFWKVIYHT